MAEAIHAYVNNRTGVWYTIKDKVLRNDNPEGFYIFHRANPQKWAQWWVDDCTELEDHWIGATEEGYVYCDL